jgi:hypothetical protein
MIHSVLKRMSKRMSYMIYTVHLAVPNACGGIIALTDTKLHRR